MILTREGEISLSGIFQQGLEAALAAKLEGEGAGKEEMLPASSGKG